MKTYSFYGKQAIIRTEGKIPNNSKELLETELFKEIVNKFLDKLVASDSVFLEIFPNPKIEGMKEELLELLKLLCFKTKDEIIKEFPKKKKYFEDCYLLHQLVENLYNYWREYERYLILFSDSENGKHHSKPYRAFNETIEKLNDLVRAVYRDICENITNTHPRIYRQVPAGFQVGVIAMKPHKSFIPKSFEFLKDIHIIRQVLIEPPLILDPPMNKRSGQFTQVKENPVKNLNINSEQWLCYPAKVGPLVINLYFHNKFIGIGTSVCNIFDMAEDVDLNKKPDAIYFFGVPSNLFKNDSKTVFYDDEENEILIGAVPDLDEFGYFGYVKKMMLTLHNIIMMKRGLMPVHGAMVKIMLKDGKNANIVVFGDSGAGKSETLEAFRVLMKDNLREMTIIYDDMGSLDIKDGKVISYGTETGAFVRLDDLQPGFAFGQLDRSIIHSPYKINSRASLPITTLKEVLQGQKVDYFLYANNYEDIEEKKPILEFFNSFETALDVFRKGSRIAKGTTSEKGLVHTYFANIFGPTQFKEIHETLAKKYFEKMFETKVKVGILRTRLGIKGYETKGPLEAAKALMKIISWLMFREFL